MNTEHDATEQHTAFCHVQLLGRLGARRREPGRGAAATPEQVITRWGTHKAAALLAYLAHHRSQSHARETLATLLWPDASREAGLHGLRQALSSLRRLLEPPGTPAGTVFVADREFLRLNPATVTTDVAAFEATLGRAGRAAGASERRACLEEAVNCYAGPLLPCHYEEWVLSERERLADRFREALDALAALAEQAGDLDEAVAFTRRAALADPLREEAHHSLMRLLLTAGQPDAALRQFREWERRLKRELGDTPSEATRQLAREAQAALAARPPAPRFSPDVNASPSPDPRRRSTSLRSPLPAGTPTFLLSDIEGSTAQWERAGAAFTSVLARHHNLLRAIFARHGGHEAAETGDGFVVAFGRAADALTCAIEVQRALAAEPWNVSAADPPLVRMALHTGDVEMEKGRYRGLTLHHAQRLLEAAHGGQILCSEATAVLLRGSSAFTEEDVNLTDLGLFRLRDVSGPVRLFQVTYPDAGCAAFGPPHARSGFAGNLPPSFTRFFGRRDEIAALAALLRGGGEDAVRLITLTGPGGTGKTRLALEAAGRLAEEFAGAVWFVPLVDVSDGRLLAGAIRDSLGLPRSAGADPVEQAADMLRRPEKALLMLDNFEQLTSDDTAVETVQTLLARVPALCCLVTSRQRLPVGGEREFAVAPLPVPEREDDAAANTPERLLAQAAIQLLVDRARGALPDFGVTVRNAGAVAELARRLEGIPLALELAAARASVLTPAQMLERLDEHRFELLVSRRRDLPERHRSLRAALDLSYQLLPADLQTFFARLSVFRGGWTAEAAEAVCEEPLALDHLAQLRECSMVLAEEGGAEGAPEMRFRMLETLRDFAGEHLASEQIVSLRQRHRDYFRALAEEADSQVTGGEQAVWLDRLEAEHDNFRAALAWCKEEKGAGGAREGLRLAGALCRFWDVRGHWSEGRMHLAGALSRNEAAQPTAERARALNGAGNLSRVQSDYAAARGFYEESLALSRALGDTRGVAASLLHLGIMAFQQGDYPTARTLLQEGIALKRELGDQSGIATSLLHLGMMASYQGDYAEARTLYAESLAHFREMGNERNAALALYHLAIIAARQGDYPTAHALQEESLALKWRLGDRWGIAASLTHLGILAKSRGNYAAARALQEESLAMFRELGDRKNAALALNNLGNVAKEQGDYAAAHSLYAESLALSRALGDRRSIAIALTNSGTVANRRGDHAAARALHEESLAIRRDLEDRWGVAASLAGLGWVAADEGDHETAHALHAESLKGFLELGDRHNIAASLEAFAALAASVQERAARAARLFGAAQSLREALSVPLPPDERHEHEHAVSVARAALDEEAFAHTWAEGRAMTLEQAAVYALEGNEA